MYATLILSILLACPSAWSMSPQRKLNQNLFITNETVIPTITIDPAKIDQFIKEVFDCKPGLTGLTLAIVQLNETDDVIAEYNHGYGIQKPYDEKSKPVDEQTRFCIGSITKQFTSGVTGVALSHHGMDFDAQLVKLLGEEGRFFNANGSDMLPTVRDLLSHRMGIPRYDTAWSVGLNGTRTEYWPKLHRLMYANDKYNAKKYRSSFEYNNWMVALAGYVQEKLTGTTWEAEVAERYFKALEMHNATFAHIFLDELISDNPELRESAAMRDNFAMPAYRVQNASAPEGYSFMRIPLELFIYTVNHVAPAGSICISSEDMLKYMKFVLSDRADDDADRELRMLKSKVAQTRAETSNYDMKSVDRTQPETQTLIANDNYALGWIKGYYRAYENIWHDGGFYGYLSTEMTFPDLKLGIFVSSTNGIADNDVTAYTTLGLFDMIMNKNNPVTSKTICAMPNADPLPNPDSLKPYEHCEDTSDVVDLTLLTGVYEHEVFGNVTIAYNASAGKFERFTFNYGKFGRGSLCPVPTHGRDLVLFKLYIDPESPLWFMNDPLLAGVQGLEFLFYRDASKRGTHLLFPGLELEAPSLQKQTYYKQGYKACEPNPCNNGATCKESRDKLDFTCICPPKVNGTLCSNGPSTDCTDIKKYDPVLGNVTGVHQINIPGISEPVQVYCDMDTEGGGWTVIQRRWDDNMNFNKNFTMYTNGFGNPAGNHSFWLGLYAMQHLAISADMNYTVRIELTDCDGRSVYEEYDNFWLGSEADSYPIHLKDGSARGSAGDGLTYNNKYFNQNNMPFSTPEKDNQYGCAAEYHSGWWFNDCYTSNLNGIFYPNCTSAATKNGDGIVWLPFHSSSYSLPLAKMKIKRMGVL